MATVELHIHAEDIAAGDAIAPVHVRDDDDDAAGFGHDQRTEPPPDARGNKQETEERAPKWHLDGHGRDDSFHPKLLRRPDPR